MFSLFCSIQQIFKRLLGFKNIVDDNTSLDTLNHKIRLFVWFFLLIHIIVVMIFSPTRLPIFFYIFCYVVWFGYLYLLYNTKNEIIKGIPYLLISVGLAYVLLEKSQNYYLRLITFSLPTLPLYAVQGFPPFFILIMGGSYLYLHLAYSDHLQKFYEPITSTYRIPSFSIHNILQGYRVALALEVICLMVYLIVMQRLWKRYMKAQKNLEEANKKLEMANQELEEANHQLLAADQLAKHVAELDHLNKQLQDALQSQDLFVACISHELRNPLNVMLGSLDLLEPYIKEPSQIQLVKTCRLCGDSLLNLINNLLDVAKINADKLEINEFATNMSLFLEEVWAYTKVGLEKKELHGSLLVDRHLPLWLNIDYHRLKQILNNLIGNAVKFTKEGSVKVTFSWIEGMKVMSCNSMPDIRNKTAKSLGIIKQSSYSEPALMDQNDLTEGDRQETYLSRTPHTLNNFLYFENNDHVKEALEQSLKCADQKGYHTLKIDIVDTGCGISEEALKTLFEPFVQGDRSVTRKFGGTGLGLYIVKKLLMKMGGDVKLTSTVNSGTQFHVTLPIKTVKRVPEYPKGTNSRQIECSQDKDELCETNCLSLDQSQLHSPLQKRVLIVDDDPFNQILLKQYFGKLGFVFDIANNGMEAVQTYEKNMGKYALITMDIQMPVMDGITACKKIRELEKEKNKRKTSIAIITANCSEDERKICLESKDIEASYFFRKPFRLSDCKLCVERINVSEPLS